MTTDYDLNDLSVNDLYVDDISVNHISVGDLSVDDISVHDLQYLSNVWTCCVVLGLERRKRTETSEGAGNDHTLALLAGSDIFCA